MYDSSFLTKRLRDKAISDSFLNRIQNATNPTTGSAPLLGISQQSIINHVNMGQMTQYRKSEGGCTLVSPGCPCGPASVAPAGPCIVDFNSYWAANISSANDEEATGVAVSACGNVYVVGYYTQQTTFNSFSAAPSSSGSPVGVSPYGTISIPIGTAPANEFTYVVKYDVNGVVQWVTHMGISTGTGRTKGKAIAIDANENVYVTGNTENTFTTNMSIYNFAGVSGGTINYTLYDTLPFTTNTSENAILVKYDTNGQAQWATTLESTPLNDRGLAIAVDSASNVYLTGYFSQGGGGSGLTINTVQNPPTAPISIAPYGVLANTTGQAAFVAKYNTNGVTQWATSITTSDDTATVQGKGVAVDSAGNVYVIGQYRIQSLTSFTVIFNSFNPAPIPPPTINVQQYGTITTTAGFLGDIFIVKYNTSGAIQWVTNMTGNSDDEGNAIAVDSSGDVYVTGMFQSTITLNTFGSQGSPNINVNPYGTLPVVAGTQATFVAKYSTTGQSISWVARIDNLNNDVGYGIAVDASGNTYVCGITNPSAGQPVVTFWSFGTQSGIPPFTPITMNPTTNTLSVTSSPPGIQSGTSGFVVKYDSTGTVQWATSLTRSVAGSNVQARGIALDPNGNIHVIGYYEGHDLLINNYTSGVSTMTLTAYGTLANTGSKDAFLVKYDPAGQIV